MKSIDYNCTKYIDEFKKEVITFACKELSNALERCNIPSIDELYNATKENPSKNKGVLSNYVLEL